MRATGDRGSALLFALGALVVVGVLGAVLLDRAGGDLRSAERSVDRASAEVLIDVAVSAAWGAIENGATAPFSDAGSTPTGSWSVLARPVGDDRWDLAAEAGDGIDAAQATVVLSREAEHPYTLFADDITTGPLTGRVRGRIGAIGDIVMRGRPLGDVQELIRPDATCVGCDNPVDVDLPRDRPEIEPVTASRPCPEVAGEISGLLDGGDPFLCDTPGVLTLVGSVDVNGAVRIVLGDDVTLDLADAVVNRGGSASDLVIEQERAGSATMTASGAVLTGVIVAPTTALHADALTWRGALDLGRLTASSGALLDGDWDPDVTELGFDGWRVVAWDLSRS